MADTGCSLQPKVCCRPETTMEEDAAGASAVLLDSLARMARHIPPCVMSDLESDTLLLQEHEQSDPHRISNLKSNPSTPSTLPDSSQKKTHHPLPLPLVDGYRTSAVLFVDISGFTNLSRVLDVESLGRAINSYFELLIGHVRNHGGDVLKFAGDAFFAEWRADTEAGDHTSSLARSALLAASCGLAIVRSGSGHRPDPSVPNAVLSVHCGLGAGRIASVHLGDRSRRREYVVLGDALRQATDAEGRAGHGEVAASAEVAALLGVVAQGGRLTEEGGAPVVICTPSELRFSPSCSGPSQSLCPFSPPNEPPGCAHPFFLEALHQQLSLYLHPTARAQPYRGPKGNENGDMAGTSKRRRRERWRGQLQTGAELRRVYTIFLHPRVKAILSEDLVENDRLFQLLNNIMVVACKVLSRYRGQLRQFIVDDKGVVLIATFGLRGSTFPNLVVEKGLPATLALRRALISSLDVDSRIGATLGRAYCGVVGALDRHEYAALGPSVNLAARLASSSDNQGVLVDEAVRAAADGRYFFDTRPPVRAKGYDGPVPVYVPCSRVEKRWDSDGGLTFVGRIREEQLLVQVAMQTMRQRVHSCGDTSGNSNNGLQGCHTVLVQAQSGYGKSSLAAKALNRIELMAGLSGKTLALHRHTCLDEELLAPFGPFRRILSDALLERHSQSWQMQRREHQRRPSIVSSDSTITASTMDTEDILSNVSVHNVNLDSEEFNPRVSDRLQLDRLCKLCLKVGRPAAFAEGFGVKILGLSPPVKGLGTEAASIQSDEAVDFFAAALLECVSNYDLGVLVLDDAQWMDSLSWRVLKTLHQRGQNLMILVLARPLEEDHTVTVDADFFAKLRQSNGEVEKEQLGRSPGESNLSVDEEEKHQRFVEVRLPSFSSDDSRELLASALRLPKGDLCDDLCEYVHDRSGGMPQFARQIAESLSHSTDLLHWRSNGKFGLKPGSSSPMLDLSADMNDLLLQRIDCLDDFTRSLLQECAVLGFEFSLSGILMVHCGGRIPTEEATVRKIQDALDMTEKESIIVGAVQGGSVARGNAIANQRKTKPRPCSSERAISMPERMYRFSHSNWRASVLSTMLKELECDFHRRVAQVLEGDGIEDITDVVSAVKVFQHWKACGDLLKSWSLARKIGAHLEHIHFNTQALDIYVEAIDLWTIDSAKTRGNRTVTEPKQEILINLTPEELDCITRLYTSVGRADSFMYTTGGAHLRSIHRILTETEAASRMKDRSVWFPVLSGLINLVFFGMIKDENNAYSRQLVDQFVSQAQDHGKEIHILHALASKSWVHSFNGEIR